MADFAPLDSAQSIVDDEGQMLERMKLWAQLVNNLATAEGSGTPEGNLEARTTKQYMDTDNGDLYIKQLNAIGNDRTMGWVLVS